jgi:hypothetical protein
MSVEILLLGEIVPVRSVHRPDESSTLHAKGSGALARFYNVGLVVADSYATRNNLRYPLTEAATSRRCLARPRRRFLPMLAFSRQRM